MADLINAKGYGKAVTNPTADTDLGILSLSRGTAQTLIPANGSIHTFNTLVGGNGYSTGIFETTASASGVGCKVQVTEINTDGSGFVRAITILNGGSGYIVGETVTLTGGSNDCTFEVVTLGTALTIGGTQKSYPNAFLCGDETAVAATEKVLQITQTDGTDTVVPVTYGDVVQIPFSQILSAGTTVNLAKCSALYF